MDFEVEVDKLLGTFRLQVTLRCEAGVLVLFGPSGAGKSLTLQCLAGIIRPDRGRIVVDGQTLFDSDMGIEMPPQRRQIGYVPQNYALFPHMSVADNIAFGLRGSKPAEARQRVSDLIAMLDLTRLEQCRPCDLSGGQQQRVALARALATRPRLLLLDEPFSALDATIRDRLRTDLFTIHKRLGVNIVFVTHGIVDTHALADTVAIIKAGRVLQVGSPSAVFRSPSTADVARLTGARNLLPGRVVRVDSYGCWVDVDNARILTRPGPGNEGEAVLVVIRPEDGRLVASGEGVTEDEEVVPGIVRVVAPQGHLYSVEVALGAASGPSLSILVPVWWQARHRVSPGDECSVAVARGAIHVLRADSKGPSCGATPRLASACGPVADDLPHYPRLPVLRPPLA